MMHSEHSHTDIDHHGWSCHENMATKYFHVCLTDLSCKHVIDGVVVQIPNSCCSNVEVGIFQARPYQRSAPGRECPPGPASPGPARLYCPGLGKSRLSWLFSIFRLYQQEYAVATN